MHNIEFLLSMVEPANNGDTLKQYNKWKTKQEKTETERKQLSSLSIEKRLSKHNWATSLQQWTLFMNTYINQSINQSTNYSQTILKQAVVRGITNPAPCCHLANDTDLLTPVLWAMAGDNKQIDLWAADSFARTDPKFNQVVPWSLHTFPENFMQIGPAVFS